MNVIKERDLWFENLQKDGWARPLIGLMYISLKPFNYNISNKSANTSNTSYDTVKISEIGL